MILTPLNISWFDEENKKLTKENAEQNKFLKTWNTMKKSVLKISSVN